MDIPDFDVENIEKALHQLYYDPSPAVKDVAQRWLMQAQRSKMAWQFAWELLQPSRKTEVQYFGASALISKIGGAWDEIPESEIDNLRNKLFSEILRLCVTSEQKIVLTRVCVAFSSFLMNCVTRQKWLTAVHDVIKKLQADDLNQTTPLQRCSALLEILTVVAEEYHTRTMERYQRGVVKHTLTQGMPHVLPLLSNILSANDFKPLHGKVLKCFSCWVVLGIPLDEYSDFLHKALACIRTPELFDNAVECLLQTFCSPEALSYSNTVKSLIPKVLELRPMLYQAVEDQDCDVCLGLTKVICGLAENQTKLILENFSNPEVGLGLILMVAECTGIRLQFPTEEMSSPISFTFWYSLQDEVRSLPPDSSPIVFAQILPIYYHLVESLLRKASYPADSSHTSWSSDEKEQHRIYRIDVSDTLMYVLEMLGPKMIQFLCDKLKEMTQQSPAWHEIEALLFGIHSIVEATVDWDEELECLHGLAVLLPLIKFDNLTLADTVICAVGAMTEWLMYNPVYLPSLLPIVLPCIYTHELAMTTVLTLKRITRECKEHLLPQAESILSTARDVLMKGTLQNTEISWLMQTVGHVLSVLPADLCLLHLQNVLMLHMHQLQALSEDEPTRPTKNSILHILEILSSLFSTLVRRHVDSQGDIVETVPTSPDQKTEKQPVLLILEQITPILERILSRWIGDTAVVSGICELYDRAIRGLLDDFAPLLPTFCDLLGKIFNTAPQTSVLDLTQQLTLVFGKDPAHEYPIGTLFRSLIETCRRMFEGGHAKDHPDLAQGFMKLLCHVLKKNYNMFFKEVPGNPSLPPPNLSLLFHCALVTFVLPESESVKSAASFFTGLSICFSPTPEISAVFHSHGKDLYLATMAAIGGKAVRTLTDCIADVLFGLAKHSPQDFALWIQESQSTADFPVANIDKAKKNMFFSNLLRAQSSKRKYRDLVRDFTLVCRGLDSSEYATA